MMQFVPDAHLITPEQRWQAGCKFLRAIVNSFPNARL